MHWTDHGPKHNLDDSGGVTIFNGTAVSLSAGGLRAVVSVATDDALLEWSPMQALFSAQAWNNRKGAMDFPGDPLAPWMDPRDPEHRWWIALAIDGCHNNTYRKGTDGFACVKGGAEQLWSSYTLFGPQAKWELVSTLGPDGIFLGANRTAISDGTASSFGLPQHTEFVTPDYFAPGSMPSAPTASTGVFMTSVYGNEPCCDAKFGRRWNYQEFLVGEQKQPGGRFDIDWMRSGAVDHSSFTPSSHGGGPELNVSYNMQYSCCGKSAFTKEGRRILLHAGIQNSGSNPKENAFSLAREVFFDIHGLLRQTFVPELRALRGAHHTARQYTIQAGATLRVPPGGNQLEIKACRLSVPSSPAATWGIIVFGSLDLKQGTKIGFNENHFFVDRRASGKNEWSKPVERDVRAGPLPRSTRQQSVHVYLDRSIISVIASNETAITAWTHPANGSTALGLFSEGEESVIELEAWDMRSILTPR
eukprot:SAG31_NODE_271_length_18717_cov_8.685949_24_plen_476_part_00